MATELEKLQAAATQYVVRDGAILFKTDRRKHKAGDVAGTWSKREKKCGETTYYKNINVNLNGKNYILLAHRLSWYLSTGELPPKVVDHIERATRPDDSLNRKENLRDGCKDRVQWANRSSNSGLTGAFPADNRWRAAINIEGTLKHLGCFATELEAHEAYKEALRNLDK